MNAPLNWKPTNPDPPIAITWIALTGIPPGLTEPAKPLKVVPSVWHVKPGTKYSEYDPVGHVVFDPFALVAARTRMINSSVFFTTPPALKTLTVRLL